MGSGSTKQITSQVQSLGTNLIAANTSSNGTKQFTLDNVKDIDIKGNTYQVVGVLVLWEAIQMI